MILPRVHPGERPSASAENFNRFLLERLHNTFTNPPFSSFLQQMAGSPYFYALQVGTITSCSVLTNSQASAVTYGGKDEDGIFTFTAQAPLWRPYNGAPLVEPAPIGSPCLVLVAPGVTGSGVAKVVTLLIAQEKLHFEECETEEVFLYMEGDGFISVEAWIVDRNGATVRSRNGDLVISRFFSLPAHPEDYIVLDRNGEVVYGRDTEPVVSRQDFGNVLQPSYWDGTLRTRAGAHVVSRTSRVAGSSKVNPPIVGHTEALAVPDIANIDYDAI